MNQQKLATIKKKLLNYNEQEVLLIASHLLQVTTVVWRPDFPQMS